MKKFTNLTLILLISIFFIALSCGNPPEDDQKVDSDELLEEIGDDETEEDLDEDTLDEEDAEH